MSFFIVKYRLCELKMLYIVQAWYKASNCVQKGNVQLYVLYVMGKDFKKKNTKWVVYLFHFYVVKWGKSIF